VIFNGGRTCEEWARDYETNENNETNEKSYAWLAGFPNMAFIQSIKVTTYALLFSFISLFSFVS
jgi:hypothetical protein